MLGFDPVFLIILLAVVLPSLTIHEYAHAWTAYKFGDDTAKSMGRLTLNPIAHIDPIGTIIVPLFLKVGWAKPVPVNFSVLSRTQMLLVSIAGPASNLLLAIVLAVAYHVLPVQKIPLVETYLWFGVFLNIALAIFNLLPIPPLDGSRIIYAGLKSPKAIMVYHQFSHFGIFIVLGLAYFGGFSLVIEPLIGFFLNLLRMPSL